MPRFSPEIRRYLLLFLLYAAGMAAYLWYTSANEVPAAFRGTAADPATFMKPDELDRSGSYSAVRSWFFFIGYPWEWGVYIILLFGGGARRLQDRLHRLRVPNIVRFPLYVATICFLTFITYLPVRFIAYRLSRANGISVQPFVGWLQDKLIGYAVNTVFVIVAATVAFWLMRRKGRWWLKLWLLSVPFTLFVMYVQPVVIDPLYDTFSRLSDPELEQKILQLAAKADVPVDRVYEVHMADKTNAMNAYVNGIGPSLRIVMWDTTMQRLDEAEILQVMAHELGHYVMHHLEWSALGAVVSSFFLLWLGSRLLGWTLRRWGERWGIGQPSDYAVLPVVLLLLSLFSFVTLPASNAVSRQAEQAADRFAIRLIGDSGGAVSMTQKMAKATLDDVNPPLLVKWFVWTHPTDMERIIDAQTYKP